MPAHARTHRVEGLALHALVVLAYSGLAMALFHAAWASPTSRLIGACCDSPGVVNTLRLTGYSLTHGHGLAVSHVMNAPHGFNIMWQPQMMPLLGVLALPFETTLGPMVTYNLVATLALALSGWAVFIALRRWLGGRAGPFVGGLFFAFSPTMTSHSLGHLDITFAVFLPLAALVGSEILVYQKWPPGRSGAVLAGLLAAQLLTGEEVLAQTLITLVVLGLVLVARFPRAVRAHFFHAARSLAIAAPIFAVLAVGPALLQFRGPQRIHGPILNTVPLTTNLASIFVPVPQTTELSTAWTVSKANAWFSGIGFSETTAYVGIPLLLALAVVVVLKRRSPLVQVTALVSAVVAVLSLGAQLHVAGHVYDIWLPWRAVRLIPVFRSLLAARIFLVVDLGIAVLVAVAVSEVLSTRRALRYASGIGLTAALVPLLPTLHYEAYIPAVPPFFTTSLVDAIPGGTTVLIAPFPGGPSGDGAPPMIWQAFADFRFDMVGGSVFVPGPHGINTEGGAATPLTAALNSISLGSSVPRPGPATVSEARLELARDHVETVLLGPMSYRQATLSFLEAIVGPPTRSEGGVTLWLHLGSHARSSSSAATPTGEHEAARSGR